MHRGAMGGQCYPRNHHNLLSAGPMLSFIKILRQSNDESEVCLVSRDWCHFAGCLIWMSWCRGWWPSSSTGNFPIAWITQTSQTVCLFHSSGESLIKWSSLALQLYTNYHISIMKTFSRQTEYYCIIGCLNNSYILDILMPFKRQTYLRTVPYSH